MGISLNHKTIDDFINNFYEDNPFSAKLGTKIGTITPGKVNISLTIVHDHTNVYGIAHGGVIMTLSDIAMGAACLSLGKKVVTLDLNTNFIKALNLGDTAFVEGIILHPGRSSVVAEATIYNDRHELCAKARGTFFVIGSIES